MLPTIEKFSDRLLTIAYEIIRQNQSFRDRYKDLTNSYFHTQIDVLVDTRHVSLPRMTPQAYELAKDLYIETARSPEFKKLSMEFHFLFEEFPEFEYWIVFNQVQRSVALAKV